MKRGLWITYNAPPRPREIFIFGANPIALAAPVLVLTGEEVLGQAPDIVGEQVLEQGLRGPGTTENAHTGLISQSRNLRRALWRRGALLVYGPAAGKEGVAYAAGTADLPVCCIFIRDHDV